MVRIGFSDLVECYLKKGRREAQGREEDSEANVMQAFEKMLPGLCIETQLPFTEICPILFHLRFVIANEIFIFQSQKVEIHVPF